MSKLDICTAMVQLNRFTTVYRGPTNPINYAEIEMLRFELGDRAVTDVQVIDVEDRDNAEVLESLRLKFGNDKVREAFPGSKPRLPMEAPSDVPRYIGGEAPRNKRKAADKEPDGATAA
jgi:hypothetical protein